MDLHGRGVIRDSLTYDDLTRRPERALQAVATACRIPVNDLDDALAIFKHDSQAGTDLSGKLLREQVEKQNDLIAELTRPQLEQGKQNGPVVRLALWLEGRFRR